MRERKSVDPKDQFSKWLARSGAVYWIIHLTLLILVMALVPAVATACVYMALIVSVVMMIHVWAYTRNSTYEKGLLALLDKTRIELSLKGGSGLKSDTDGNNGDATDEEETEDAAEDYNEEEGWTG
jgi:hypothetical protein